MISVTQDELVNVVHARLLALRNIETLVTSRDFKQYYDPKNKEHRSVIRKLVNDFDHEGLRTWYRKIRLDSLGTLGVRELRVLASQLGVRGYNFLTKPMLLSEISNRTKLNAQGPNNQASDSAPRGDEGVDSEIRDYGGKISIYFEGDREGGYGCNGGSHLVDRT